MIFDHWQTIDSNPSDSLSRAGKLVDEIRKRKGLKPGVPPLENFLDKL
jgi:elongation factor 2